MKALTEPSNECQNTKEYGNITHYGYITPWGLFKFNHKDLNKSRVKMSAFLVDKGLGLNERINAKNKI